MIKIKKNTLIIFAAGFIFLQPIFGSQIALAQNTCQNECSFFGQHESQGTSGRSCGNFDADVCLEWSSWQTCDIQSYFCGDGTCNVQCGEKYNNCSKDCASNPVIIVSAGSNKEIWEGASVVLEGSSSESGGAIQSNRWSCNAGSLSNNDALWPTYFAPSVFQDTNFSCTLTAKDYQGQSNSASVTIAVKKRVPTLNIELLAKNITQKQTTWQKFISAIPSDRIEFRVAIVATADTSNIFLKNILPSGISYNGNLPANFNIGNLAKDKSKAITFEGKILPENNFTIGTTGLINIIQARANFMPEVSDTVTINVIKPPAAFAITEKEEKGPATSTSQESLVKSASLVSTGITNGVFESLLLPLVIALLLVLAFKSQIIWLDEWLDKKRVKIRNYKTEASLKRKISHFRNHEKEIYETWRK